MDMTNQEYGKLVKEKAKPSPMGRNLVWAFLVGGLICTVGQVLLNICRNAGLDQETAGTVTSVALVFVAALLTGLGWFDNIAKHAGAGTLVPITGFANAVVSPAIDSKSEGFVLGVGAKIFTVAGPVLLYGTLAGCILGVISWLCEII